MILIICTNGLGKSTLFRTNAATNGTESIPRAPSTPILKLPAQVIEYPGPHRRVDSPADEVLIGGAAVGMARVVCRNHLESIARLWICGSGVGILECG